MAISRSKRLSTDAFCPAHCTRQVTMSFTPAGGPQSVTEVVGPRPNLDLSDKYFKLPEKSSFEDMARGFDNEKYISIQTRI